MANVTQEETSESKNESGTQNNNDVGKIKLNDMKAADLKVELEKRNLDKSGVKSVLIERLKEALLEDGENPDECTFEVSCDSQISKSDALSEDTNGNAEDDVENEADTAVNKEAEVIDITDDSNHEETKTSNNDATLQITIDEEEAQLNEEESIKNEEAQEKKIAEPDSSSAQDSTKKDKPKASDKNTSPKVTKKLEKEKSDSVYEKSIWITGLPNDIRAADLKVLCSKQGKVLSVKIIKNTKRIPCRCYGYVTMSNSKEATKAIQNLHRVEVNGRVICVERATNEPAVLLKKQDTRRAVVTKKPPVKKDAKPKEEGIKATSTEHKSPAKNEAKSGDSKTENKKSDIDKDKSKEKDKKLKEKKDKHSDRKGDDRSKAHFTNSRYGSFNRRPMRGRVFGNSNFRSRPAFFQRDPLPARDNFREREEERRRVIEHRFIERRQKEEALRLEREKEKLRLERDLLERERTEILKLEREKQRLERERLEREREELRRVVEFRQSLKRSFVQEQQDLIWDNVKRPATSRNMQQMGASGSKFDFVQRNRQAFSHQDIDQRQQKRFFPVRSVEPPARAAFGNRDSRRDIAIRREDRRVINNSRDNRRGGFTNKDRRSAGGKRDNNKDVWKQDRRVVSSNNSGNQRRMNFY